MLGYCVEILLAIVKGKEQAGQGAEPDLRRERDRSSSGMQIIYA